MLLLELCTDATGHMLQDFAAGYAYAKDDNRQAKSVLRQATAKQADKHGAKEATANCNEGGKKHDNSMAATAW